MAPKITKISFDKSPAGLYRVYGKYRTVCCYRTMNVRGVWQTTYRIDLFGSVALKDILYDLNEFWIPVVYSIIIYHKGGLIF